MGIIRLFVGLTFLFTLASPGKAQHMDDDQITEILTAVSDTIRLNDNVREFFIQDVIMYCITDALNNRMRIIAPIAEMENISVDQVNDAMEANFHSALDVRYCISDQLMWVAYIHPFRELSEEQVVDAIGQLYSATLTFGSEYASTSLIFPEREGAQRPPQKKY